MMRWEKSADRDYRSNAGNFNYVVQAQLDHFGNRVIGWHLYRVLSEESEDNDKYALMGTYSSRAKAMLAAAQFARELDSPPVFG